MELCFLTVYTQALMHFNFCKATICDFCAITASPVKEMKGAVRLSSRSEMVLNSFLLPITPSRYSRNTCRTDQVCLCSFMEVH